MDWSTPTLSITTNYFDLLRACICPCVEINDIAHLLVFNPKHPNANHDISCCAATLTSIIIDIPILFGLQITKSKYIDKFLFPNEDEDDYDQDSFEPDYENVDSIPFSWCAFYSMAAFENCCATLCCGPKISHTNFPPIFALCLLAIYPLCICPLSCILRQGAKEKLGINTESIVGTLIRSSICIPCSLVQIRKSLESQSGIHYGPPPFINHM